MHLGIIGNYGATNAGDDAILEAILKKLKGYEITVFSANPKETEKRFQVSSAPLFPLGIRSFFKHGFRRPLQALKKADAVILGGGGLFQDDRLFACFLWAWQLFWVFFYEKPVFIWATGVGPLKTWIGQKLTRWVYRHTELITVRDVESKNLLVTLGLPESAVKITADPAFLFFPEARSAERRTHRFMISVRPWLTHEGRLFLAFTDFLLWLKAEKKAEFVFVPMQTIKESDGPLLKKLADRVGGALFYPQDFSDLMRRMSECEFAVGMRYHFLIAALLTATPMIPVSYSPKIEALFRGTPLGDYLIPVADLTSERLKMVLKRMSVDYNNVRIYAKKRAEALFEAAERSSALLNQWIEDLRNSIDRSGVNH